MLHIIRYNKKNQLISTFIICNNWVKGTLFFVPVRALDLILHYKLIIFREVTEDNGPNDVVVTMFDFHRSDRGSNPGRGDKISCLRLHYRAAPLASV